MSEPTGGGPPTLHLMAQEMLARRRAIIAGVAEGRMDPVRAAALVLRDAQRLSRATMRAARGAGARRARWLWIKVRPEGWSRRLSFPLPLALVRASMGLAGRTAGQGSLHAGPVDLDWAQLRGILGSLPRCGRLVQIQDGRQYVEIWLT